MTSEVKIGAKFDKNLIAQVCNKSYRQALLKRLSENGYDAKKAFTGKNAWAKNPVCFAPFQALPEKIKLVSLQEE